MFYFIKIILLILLLPLSKSYHNLKKNNFISMNVNVNIQVPSINVRQITASIIIDSSLDNIWSLITDYNNLSKYIPNLTKSYIIPNKVIKMPNKIRIFQEGSQKIIGFNFKASLILDMQEQINLQERILYFNLVESKMFKSFNGTWNLKSYNIKEYNEITKIFENKCKTKLTYTVFIESSKSIPIIALEWRIREDLPINLKSIEYAIISKLK